MTAPATLPDRDRLLELIVELAVVHGRVTLSSGREADWYIDMRRLTLHHEGAPLVGRVMRQLTGDLRYDAVGGLTLGADPVAAAMLHAAAAGEASSTGSSSARPARRTACSGGSRGRTSRGARCSWSRTSPPPAAARSPRPRRCRRPEPRSSPSR